MILDGADKISIIEELQTEIRFSFILYNMSNTRINTSFSLEFLGEYMIKSAEIENGNELNGEARMRVPMKEGIGLLVEEDRTLFMKLMFVNDECEGEVTKVNKYGGTVLKGRVSRGKEVGIWIEYDDNGNERWRGLYRNGKRYVALNEQEGMKGFSKR